MNASIEPRKEGLEEQVVLDLRAIYYNSIITENVGSSNKLSEVMK